MRKQFFILMLGLYITLGSCDQIEEKPLSHSDKIQVTLNVDIPRTRAAGNNLSRFILEAYEGDVISDQNPELRMESMTGAFVMELTKNVQYTFLFWADHGTPAVENAISDGYYNTADLKAVKAKDPSKIGEEAFCAHTTFQVRSDDDPLQYNVTLHHAVAKLSFENSDKLLEEDNNLTVTYNQSITLNVLTEVIIIDPIEIQHQFTKIPTIEGVIAVDYILAPGTQATLTTLDVQLNEEEVKSIPNIPIKMNYITHIKGAYSDFYNSLFTVGSSVNDYMENNKPF